MNGPAPTRLKGWKATRPLLICYAPVGDPHCTDRLLSIYAEYGVDVVEIGIPTADPYLDGPAVANSMRRVMAASDHLKRISDCIEANADAIAGRCRLVLMGYANMEVESFTLLARRSLVHGVLSVDTVEGDNAARLHDWIASHNLVRVGFVDSALSPAAIDSCRMAGGYIMLQSHDGPTGVRSQLDSANEHRIFRVKNAIPRLPVVLGFGIGTPQQAAQAILWGADGVVVGSACIAMAQRGELALRDFIVSLRQATDDAAKGHRNAHGVQADAGAG